MQQRVVGRRGLLAGATGLFATPTIVRAQGQTNGVALVIGNSKYKWEASLPNVKRDAPDVAKRFQELGLKTELLQDSGRDAMRAAVDKFATSARGANLAAFYFAGHGASWDKDTYLVPEDADLASPSTVQNLLPVTAVRDAVKDASHRLLVFDNCRNNPADGWRQREALISSSVARNELAAAALNSPNTLVLFSTAPGRIAVDGPAGDNSPFAARFLRQLAWQSVDLQALPAKLRRDLLIATDGRQVLWDQSTYDQPFLLTSVPNRQAGPSPSNAGTVSGQPKASSQIVELDNSYAFAREKGLLLPPGLVALRSVNDSPHNSKIGSFQTSIKVNIGRLANNNSNQHVEPFLLIVVSVTDAGTAEIIFATRSWDDTGGQANGILWRYSTATLSGPNLNITFGRHHTATEGRVEFKWSDANSGRQANLLSYGWHHSPFTRLDG